MDLIDAADNGNIDRVRELLDNGVDPDINRFNLGNTALFWALREGHIDIVRLLLDSGANPNIINSDGETALIEASRENHWDTHIENINFIRLLLDYGSDPNITDSEGETALEIAEDNGHYDIAELIKSTIVSRNSDPDSILSDPDSIPSDPDPELMRNQAATRIQRITRGRQTRQMRNYTRRNTGLRSSNPTMRERFRRFTDHNRMLDENDPLSGYLHDIHFPPKMSSKSSKSKSKRSKHKGGKKRSKHKKGGKKRSKHKGGKRGKSSIKKRSNSKKGGNKRNNKK